jgi:flagellar FliL protein
MAREEKQEELEGEGEQVAPMQPNKLKKILIFCGVPALLLAIGIPVAIIALRSPVKPDQEAPAHELSQDAPVPEGYNDEDELDEGEEPLGAILPFDTLVVNLSEGGYLRLQLQLEFDDQDVPRRAYARLIPMRDAMITLLSSRNASELLSTNGKNHLKTDLKELVNDLLRKELVKDVYFTQFVIQQS